MNASNSDAPAIDGDAYAALEDLADGDASFLVDLVRQYLTDADSLVAALVAAAESEDARGVETAAHTLKSASANVGAMTLSQHCLVLQSRGREENLDGCLDLSREAEAEFSRVRAELEKRVQAYSG